MTTLKQAPENKKVLLYCLLALWLAGCNRPESLLQRGNMAYQQADLERAAEFYGRAREHNSTKAAASYNLGRVFFEQKDFSRAKMLFGEALTLELENPMIRVYRARAALELGEDELAERDLRLTTRLHPEVGDGHFYLGELLGSQGHYEEALKEMERARKTSELREDATIRMAQWQRERGQPKAAADLLEELLSTHGFRYQTYLDLGRNLIETEDYSKAEFFLRKGLSINPGDSEGLFRLGIAFEQQSKTDLARELFDAVVEKGEAPWTELAAQKLDLK
jgi:tetratricopeptide (TPR) repeat protein